MSSLVLGVATACYVFFVKKRLKKITLIETFTIDIYSSTTRF